jgi:uncharacterized integral membrane protein
MPVVKQEKLDGSGLDKLLDDLESLRCDMLDRYALCMPATLGTYAAVLGLLLLPVLLLLLHALNCCACCCSAIAALLNYNQIIVVLGSFVVSLKFVGGFGRGLLPLLLAC